MEQREGGPLESTLQEISTSSFDARQCLASLLPLCSRGDLTALRARLEAESASLRSAKRTMVAENHDALLEASELLSRIAADLDAGLTELDALERRISFLLEQF